jgi:hypothetical protein
VPSPRRFLSVLSGGHEAREARADMREQSFVPSMEVKRDIRRLSSLLGEALGHFPRSAAIHRPDETSLSLIRKPECEYKPRTVWRFVVLYLDNLHAFLTVSRRAGVA